MRMGPQAGEAIEYLSEFEPFNSLMWNKNENRAWRMNIGDISYGLGKYYNSSVIDTVFFKYFLVKTTS